jgi:CheY-like chemotaxis protein
MGPTQRLKLSAGQEPPKVLVVDDEASAHRLLSRLLEPSGFSVRHADNGEQAVEVAREWLPQVVLMDLQMPLLDGLGATRAIKKTAWGAAMIVIIVSGSTTAANVADAIAAGALTFIGKPYTDAEILAALGSALNVVYG